MSDKEGRDEDDYVEDMSDKEKRYAEGYVDGKEGNILDDIVQANYHSSLNPIPESPNADVYDEGYADGEGDRHTDGDKYYNPDKFKSE